MDENKLINKAKIRLFTERNTTFFSALLANLKLEWTDRVPTGATNGTHLYLNKDFVKSLSLDEILFLLLHEVYHVALDHVGRRDSANLDPMLWNVAGDYVINNDLDNRGYKMPVNGILDHQYDGWSTRQVYDHLVQYSPDETCDLDIIPCSSDDKQQQEKITTNIVKAVTQAKIANDYGSVPGNIARHVEELLDPKLPWNQILMDYMHSYAKEDYSWKRPNKKYWPDFYLPGMRSENLQQITIGVDVSASIDQEDLDYFSAEIRYIFDFLKPQKMRIMSFDTRVRDNLEYEEGAFIDNLILHGGGGTDIYPLIQSIKKDKPEVCIIFSDLDLSMPDLSNLSTDLIWVKVGNLPTPKNIGKVIQYESA
jgi:predicted metal-dependent peptidase